jgi:hypothetical protein
VTPITVTGTLLIRTVLPIALGSAANRRRQKASLSIATAGASALSSLSSMTRPIAAGTCMTRK